MKRTAEEEADDSATADRRNRGDDIDPSPTAQGVDTSMAPESASIRSMPASDKRELAAPAGESSSPQKTPKISSICFGIGSADKIGEVTIGEHEEELKEMTKEYLRAIESGDCFVHV